LTFDDVDPSEQGLDSIADGQLYRLRREAQDPTRGGRGGRGGHASGLGGRTRGGHSNRGGHAFNQGRLTRPAGVGGAPSRGHLPGRGSPLRGHTESPGSRGPHGASPKYVYAFRSFKFPSLDNNFRYYLFGLFCGLLTLVLAIVAHLVLHQRH